MMIEKLAGAANRNGQLPVGVEQSASDWQVDEYWKTILQNRTHALNLPLDFVRPAVKGGQRDAVTYKTTLALQRELALAAENEAVSVEVVLLAALMLLLAKYTGQEYVVVGWTSNSVQHACGGSETACTTVVAGCVEQSRTWREFLAAIEQTCLQARAPKRFSYEQLVDTMDADQDPSRNPLFDVRLKQRHTETARQKDDFALGFDVERDGISLRIEYDASLFFSSTMERLLRHYVNLLTELVRDGDQRLADVDMLSADERERLVYGWNETATAYPSAQSIAHMLEQQVEQRPEDIAVVFGEQSLTYKQLHAHSNQIAHALHQRGIGEGDVVVVMAERSLELITGLLGVLKAGAAYTPVDPGYPAERLRYLLHHSQAKLLLVQRAVQDRIADTDAEVVAVEDLLAAKWPSDSLPLPYDPERLMYVLYTSGSTGNPKGAMIRAHAFVNLLHWYTREFSLGENDRMLLIASASFDLAQKNLYAPLITGGRLVLFEPGLYDYEQMAATIEREGITAINCTPSAFYPLVDASADDDYAKLKSLRWVFLGGEPIHMTQLAPWLRSAHCQAEIVNTYGPTECTDIASYYRVSGKDWQGETKLPIGKPIDNVRLYVVDKDMRLVPEGLEGELCIGGVGVGLGYYNAPELTEERFVQSSELPEQVVYKTGDVVKRLPDGQIVFIGRVDHQVKVRGFRIEIEEIEKKLLDHPQVKEAVVTAVQDAGGDTSLRAYVVPASSLTTEQVYDYLHAELPGYMVPQFVILLEALPLTPNGKVDRKALPVPTAELAQAEEQTGEQAEEQAAPEKREIEQQLAKLWQEVLGIRKIGLEDSFFRLGGHSLKAVALLSRIKKAFGVSIPIPTLFRKPTVRQLAEVIRQSPQTAQSQSQSDPVATPRAGKQRDQTYYRLSSEQERLYVLAQFEHVGTAYNVPWAAVVYGPFDVSRCQQAFAALSLRHESLRTCFELVGDTVLQKVLQKADGFFTYTEANGAEHEQPEQLIRPFIRPFDLGVGPLFRVNVVRLGADEHLLFLDMHHIVADGISLQLVLQEFAALYEGKTLEPLPMQYKDYANWQGKRRETLQAQEAYWLDVLQGELPVLNLPLDYPRPPLQSFEGDKVTTRIDRSLAQKLRQVAEDTNSTLYMVLLAAYDVLLHKYTGQTDIVVGSPVGGRQQPEFERLVGMFVNTLALRSFPQPDKPFRDFLAEVRESCLKAYEHQEWPFEKLVEKLQPVRDLSRNPLFDTMFVLQNMENALPRLPGVELVALPINNRASQFDLMLEAIEQEDGLELNLEFCTKLFATRTMERLLRHYCHLLEQLVQDTDQRLADLDMLAADGDEPLVYDRGHNLTTDSADPVRSAAHQPQRKQQAEHPEKSAAVPGERQASINPLPALEAAEKRPDYPASSAQKRLFMLDKLLGRSTAYNVPVIRNINGRVDSKRLEKALQGLVERHESLRTAFHLEVESGALRQKVHSAVPFAFPVYALTEAEAAEMIRDFVRPFRLDKAPLFRAALIELTDKKESILILDMHHAITDGLSVGIMLKELAALYENRQLEPLSLQYKDYAVWESQLMHTQEWKKQEAYWLERFKEPVHPVRLRFSRPPALTAEATSRTLHFSLEENTATALQNLAHSTETTLFMVMLAAFTVLLSRLSGQDDIVVGTPISGRHREGLENIVGMFVNTLAIRNQPRSSQSFLTYLHQVKERLLDAYENQDYAFDQLVDKLNVPREINGNPLFNVMFQFAQHDEAETIDGLKLQAVEYDGAPGKFDLHFVVVQENQRALHLEMTYREAYLPDETAREFLAHFHGLVQQIVRDVQQDGKEEIATPHP